MKKMAWRMGILFMVLLGISETAFAKHHHPYKKEDDQDNKDNEGRKVACFVNGVKQMVKSENVCKDFNGIVMTDKTPQGATAVSKEKITEQKTQSK